MGTGIHGRNSDPWTQVVYRKPSTHQVSIRPDMPEVTWGSTEDGMTADTAIVLLSKQTRR
jgi:hypothetical protein